MNFKALKEAAIATINDSIIKGEPFPMDTSKCLHAVCTKSHSVRAFQVVSTIPETIEEALKKPPSYMCIYYTMIVQPDACYVCGKPVLSHDIENMWKELHPNVPQPNWESYRSYFTWVD